MRVMNSFGTAKNLLNVMKEISFDEIREEAELPPRMLVTADHSDDGEAVAQNLSGESRTPYITVKPLDTPVDVFNDYEAVVVFDPDLSPDTRERIDKFSGSKNSLPVVTFRSFDPHDTEAARDVRSRLISQLPSRAPAFGRYLPGFRTQTVKAVIDETAVANAQFALIANVPTLVPLVGSLAVATADFLVLTKNQLVLVFKIAAIHGEDLNDRVAIMKEMAPVAGAGFFWRTLAREATVFVPFAAGSIPKVAIAYSGTVAVGRAADHYYRFGEKPSKELMKSFYKSGMEAVKHRAFPFRSGNTTVDADYRVIDEEPAHETNQPA